MLFWWRQGWSIIERSCKTWYEAYWPLVICIRNVSCSNRVYAAVNFSLSLSLNPCVRNSLKHRLLCGGTCWAVWQIVSLLSSSKYDLHHPGVWCCIRSPVLDSTEVSDNHRNHKGCYYNLCFVILPSSAEGELSEYYVPYRITGAIVVRTFHTHEELSFVRTDLVTQNLSPLCSSPLHHVFA